MQIRPAARGAAQAAERPHISVGSGGVGPVQRDNSLLREEGLSPVRSDRRTFNLVCINVYEPDVHAGKGLPALHVNHRIGNEALALGQVAAVLAAEAARNFDI